MRIMNGLAVQKIGQFVCLLFGIGLWWKIYYFDKSVGTFLFFHFSIPTNMTDPINFIYLAIFGGLLVGLLFNKSASYGFLALASFISAFMQFYSGDSFAYQFVFLAHMIRIFLPIGLCLLILHQTKLAKELLKIALACTFMTHGLEAYKGHPLFYDFIFNFFDKFSLELDSTQVGLLLKLIAFQDWVLVLSIFVPFSRRFGLIYMILWGALTSAVRWEYLGLEGTHEFLLRLPNFYAPFLLVSLEQNHLLRSESSNFDLYGKLISTKNA